MPDAKINISICAPKDERSSDVLKLAVSTRAPLYNPSEWKDLWLLSPFSTVDDGVPVPGLPGVRSKTVENAWQFLKIWPGETSWNEDIALAAFQSTCAIRYPKGRGKQGKAIGAYWGEDGSTLGYIEARRRIYVPCYIDMLKQPDRGCIIERLRATARIRPVCIYDPDSYDITKHGMKKIEEALHYEQRPFAHAFVVALAVQDRVSAIL